MDASLKEILKEERRRREEKKEREERRERTERKDKKERKERNERRERKEKEGSERTERKSNRSVIKERVNRHKEIENIEERQEPEEMQVQQGHEGLEEQEQGTLGFMFVYEDKDGNLFSSLDNLKKEGETIKIFPVYVTGGNENLTEEQVTYSDGNFIPSEENKETSWLKVISSTDVSIISFDLEDIVVYNGKFFHCDKDLFEYMESNGLEYLSVSK